ncbi:hypothetical protein B0H17DRAFT_1028426 [Mycena rosella]|uniref:Uncharacterized protein n=1 Tax=Mycena rosella TaxID=1033263 RepID=A0AAD7MC15_MYCRO|nr:hypothetical protein B0H17DRAFT_1028426 [Mycena rosella]
MKSAVSRGGRADVCWFVLMLLPPPPSLIHHHVSDCISRSTSLRLIFVRLAHSSGSEQPSWLIPCDHFDETTRPPWTFCVKWDSNLRERGLAFDFEQVLGDESFPTIKLDLEQLATEMTYLDPNMRPSDAVLKHLTRGASNFRVLLRDGVHSPDVSPWPVTSR